MAAKQAILLIALAIIFSLGFSAVDAGYGEAGTTETVTNESWTTDPGNWTELANSNIEGADYLDNETVYDSSDTEVTEGTDYEWNRSTGEVKAIEGGALDPAQSANISYAYITHTEHQQGFMALFAGVMDPATVLLIVLAVITILAGLKFLAGGV